MSIGKERGGILFGFVAATFLFLLTLLVLSGCDEGMNMMPPPPVVEEPTDPVGPTTEPTTNGEVKKPDDEKPTEPEEPAPQPTVTISTAAQADDGSITVSGVSTNLPEGTAVTVTLDGAVTTITTTNATGAWTVTVPPTETKRLSAGTVAITATATNATAGTGSVEYMPQPQPTVTITSAVQVDDGSVTVSGVSTDLSEGTPVTVTLGSGITVTTTVDATGAWTVTVPVTKARKLGAGTFSVTATAANTTVSTGTIEYVPLTIEEEVVRKYAQYNFSDEVVQRLVERMVEIQKIWDEYGAGKITAQEASRRADVLYEKAYGISGAEAYELLQIYIEENPEEEYLFGGWNRDDVGLAYLIIKRDHPDTTWEEVKELFRQGSRDGSITVGS